MDVIERLQQRFGERRPFVHYCHDAEIQRRCTTVELTIDESFRPARNEAERLRFPP